MELRGRKLQMLRHDRCSADDLYFGVVRGHACHSALFILLSKVAKKKHLCSSTLDGFWLFLRGRMGRNHGRNETKLPCKMVLIHFVKDFRFKCFNEHLVNFRSAIRGCYLPSFIQKSPLVIFKRRCNLYQMADSYFWTETLPTARDEFSLNRFEPTSLTEWEECVIVAGKALPQLVQCTIFQLVCASFFLRVVIWEPLGLFIMTIWMFQPGILANRSVPSMRLGWFSCGDGDGCIYIGHKCLFPLRADIWLQRLDRGFHNLKSWQNFGVRHAADATDGFCSSTTPILKKLGCFVKCK